MLLTTHAAPLLLAMLVIFALATAQGRRMLTTFDPLFALIVVVVLVVPYAMFAARAEVGWPLPLPEHPCLQDGLWRWLDVIGGLALALAGIALLVIVNSRRLAGGDEPERAPTIWRAKVDPLGRNFVYCFAIRAAGVLQHSRPRCYDLPSLIAGTGTVLLMSGLGVVVAAGDLIYLRRQRFLRRVWLAIIALPALFLIVITLAQPWALGNEVRTMFPARDIGAFFADSFQRRTGQPLAAVAGDPQLATADQLRRAAPAASVSGCERPTGRPGSRFERFNETGGVIVWRAAEHGRHAAGRHRPALPGIVPEVPRSFQRYLTGRQPLLRVGWAIVRPAQAAGR